MRDFVREQRFVIGLIALLISWTALMLVVGPERIVAFVGVENTYLVAFLLAVFGGLSAPTGTSFFAAVATFAAGGASPLYLALIGGFGIFLSDTVFFFIARRSIEAFHAKTAWLTRHMHTWMERLPVWLVLSGAFIYIGFTPLPNDLLMIAFALAGFRYRVFAPVVLAGSIAIVFNAAILGARLLN